MRDLVVAIYCGIATNMDAELKRRGMRLGKSGDILHNSCAMESGCVPAVIAGSET